MHQSIILTIGPPACGKTTWAEMMAERKGFVNLNRDDIREELYGIPYFYSTEKETKVSKTQRDRALRALREGKTVIISDTNLNPRTVDTWWQVSCQFQIPMYEKHFKTSLDFKLLCERNKARGKDEVTINGARTRKVPHSVMQKFYTQYRQQTYKQYKRDVKKPRAVIFDIDGTLAAMYMRGPFDWKKVGNDLVHDDVADIARDYFYGEQDVYVIMLTGREDVCEEETRQWLLDNEIPCDMLLMRPRRIKEKDDIVKYDLFKKHIEPHYNVIGCYEDRTHVVDMWRNIGVRCYQVANGDF